jgi:hypothetical protein
VSLPDLPRPDDLDLAAVAALGSQLVAWAETSEDFSAVLDVAYRWHAITEYVRRTSREGTAEAEAVLRQLEVRAGELVIAKRGSGELATHGGDRKVAMTTLHDLGISRQEAADFCLMAAHADVVEEVIAASDDACPPSRRRCLTEIARRRELAELVAEAAALEELAPRIHAALAALPDDPPADFIVTLRFHDTHADLVKAEIGDFGADRVSLLSIEEAL